MNTCVLIKGELYTWVKFIRAGWVTDHAFLNDLKLEIEYINIYPSRKILSLRFRERKMGGNCNDSQDSFL